jgi:hypothetical protein
MRGRVRIGLMPATACSASSPLRPRDTPIDRSLADDVEAVFVLVTFRRFGAITARGADPGGEKACGYDHDANRARFAPLSRFDCFVPTTDFAFFNPAIVPVGDAGRKLMRAIDKFLSVDCASASSISTIHQILGQFCQILNSR